MTSIVCVCHSKRNSEKEGCSVTGMNQLVDESDIYILPMFIKVWHTESEGMKVAWTVSQVDHQQSHPQ